MVEEHNRITDETAVDSADAEGKRSYERSTIEFPYNDLEDAIRVARAIHTNAGLSCTLDQLAAYLGLSITSGAFRGRVANAGTFRLTENLAGEVRLSELGRQILDPAQEAATKVQSFLEVPLYKAIFEKYRGYTLPPPNALENEMTLLGVSSKQTGKARQAFMRSARQAGFFEQGGDRLVKPALAGLPSTRPIDHVPETTLPKPGGGGEHGTEGLSLDPLLIALLKKIPSPAEGWPAAKRLRWFRTLAMNVSQIYDDEGEPVEMKIELETNGSVGAA